MIAIAAGLFGLVIGSILNVVIHRVPICWSIVWPSSRYPSRGERIKRCDNLPVRPCRILRGWCWGCKVHVLLHCPLVEA